MQQGQTARNAEFTRLKQTTDKRWSRICEAISKPVITDQNMMNVDSFSWFTKSKWSLGSNFTHYSYTFPLSHHSMQLHSFFFNICKAINTKLSTSVSKRIHEKAVWRRAFALHPCEQQHQSWNTVTRIYECWWLISNSLTANRFLVRNLIIHFDRNSVAVLVPEIMLQWAGL